MDITSLRGTIGYPDFRRARPCGFCLVSEATLPEETGALLRDACSSRRVPFEKLTAKAFDFDPLKRLEAGDLLYNAAVSTAGFRVEQFLFAPGVATFHAAQDGVYFSVRSQTLLAESAGIPIPRTVYLASSQPAHLERQVERVGGFPVGVKVLGRFGGIGVMLAESTASLRSLVDYVIAQGHNPLLCELVPDAAHWRVVVLGRQVIATYRNKQSAGDFRSAGSKDPEIFRAVPPALVIEVALRAAVACRLEFAGVDVLEDRGGNVRFLEANFPFYYPHAQLHGGVDIAGQMVDYLLAKAERLATGPPGLAPNGICDARH